MSLFGASKYLKRLYRAREAGFVPILSENEWPSYMKEMRGVFKGDIDEQAEEFLARCGETDSWPGRVWAPRYALGYGIGEARVLLGQTSASVEQVLDQSLLQYRRTCRLLRLTEVELYKELFTELREILTPDRILDPGAGEADLDPITRITAIRPPGDLRDKALAVFDASYTAIAGPAYDMHVGFTNWLREKQLLMSGVDDELFITPNEPEAVRAPSYVLFDIKILDWWEETPMGG
jgi:hypothetical protein